MIVLLCAISVIHSACGGGSAAASQIRHQIDVLRLHSSNQNSHLVHTMMRARRLPTTMAFQRLATNIYAGKRCQPLSTTVDVYNPTIRRRSRRRHNIIGIMMSMEEDDSDATTKVTQYTINDSICPPTDPETLENIVQKHIHTLPRYWFSKPVAKHTEAAFEEALCKLLRVICLEPCLQKSSTFCPIS